MAWWSGNLYLSVPQLGCDLSTDSIDGDVIMLKSISKNQTQRNTKNKKIYLEI